MTARARPGEQNLFLLSCGAAASERGVQAAEFEVQSFADSISRQLPVLAPFFSSPAEPEAGLQVLQRCYGMLWHWSEFPNPA